MGSDNGLQQAALDHLWLHFTSMGEYADPADLQVIVKGDGCYLEDANGKRYLDALSGLFCVNAGYGFGEEMGEAAAAQMRRASRGSTRWPSCAPPPCSPSTRRRSRASTCAAPARIRAAA